MEIVGESMPQLFLQVYIFIYVWLESRRVYSSIFYSVMTSLIAISINSLRFMEPFVVKLTDKDFKSQFMRSRITTYIIGLFLIIMQSMEIMLRCISIMSIIFYFSKKVHFFFVIYLSVIRIIIAFSLESETKFDRKRFPLLIRALSSIFLNSMFNYDMSKPRKIIIKLLYYLEIMATLWFWRLSDKFDEIPENVRTPIWTTLVVAFALCLLSQIFQCISFELVTSHGSNSTKTMARKISVSLSASKSRSVDQALSDFKSGFSRSQNTQAKAIEIEIQS
jgi:hypothetical protein